MLLSLDFIMDPLEYQILPGHSESLPFLKTALTVVQGGPCRVEKKLNAFKLRCSDRHANLCLWQACCSGQESDCIPSPILRSGM